MKERAALWRDAVGFGVESMQGREGGGR
jgi:hypothetical protein